MGVMVRLTGYASYRTRNSTSNSACLDLVRSGQVLLAAPGMPKKAPGRFEMLGHAGALLL